MANTIELFKAEGFWHAIFSDFYTIQLFGTDTIPTPYSASMPADKVLKLISDKNPNSIVRLK